MPSLIRLDIDNFPISYGVIDVPPNLLLYRGYNTHFPSISNRPAYYSPSMSTAAGYVRDENCTVGAFRTTQTLRFYDLRFIRTMLADIFPQRKSNSIDVINCCKTLALAYGICSLKRQIELLRCRYIRDDPQRLQSVQSFLDFVETQPTISGVDPIEARGIRVAETNNDANAVLFLKEIFGGRVHGYIAPRLYSPYHIEKRDRMHNAELVVFDPLHDGIVHVENPEQYEVETHTPTAFLREFQNVHFTVPGFDQPRLKIKGNLAGGASPNAIFDRGGKHVERMETAAHKTIKKLLGNTALEPADKYVKPAPIYDICPWSG